MSLSHPCVTNSLMGTVPLLKLEHVSKNYRAAEGSAPVEVLRDVSLEVGAGESLAIIGPSGSGKSTLLNIIGTLDHADSGKVWLGDKDLGAQDERALAAIRNHEIGFIFQAHHLLPHCTVWENVLVPTLAEKSSRSANGAEQRAERLLKRVGLDHRSHHRPGQLSGGERQRVAVVRALINQPKLLLADEPTGALDRVSAEELAKLLGELNREENVTLIVVTHALDLARQMQRLFVIQNGQLVQQ
ncbi:MAG TPA: ABC transporter ATP-binding protein [Candidatus Limnocylindria bacterium]|nr:ABC transporter ATP-binding protein [Candidatus Limnocylindria bacterium]